MHVYFATGSHVICKGSHTGSMGVSDHEEADTRMCIHIQDALQKGAKMVNRSVLPCLSTTLSQGVIPHHNFLAKLKNLLGKRGSHIPV